MRTSVAALAPTKPSRLSKVMRSQERRGGGGGGGGVAAGAGVAAGVAAGLSIGRMYEMARTGCIRCTPVPHRPSALTRMACATGRMARVIRSMLSASAEGKRLCGRRRQRERSKRKEVNDVNSDTREDHAQIGRSGEPADGWSDAARGCQPWLESPPASPHSRCTGAPLCSPRCCHVNLLALVGVSRVAARAVLHSDKEVSAAQTSRVFTTSASILVATHRW